MRKSEINGKVRKRKIKRTQTGPDRRKSKQTKERFLGTKYMLTRAADDKQNYKT